MKYWIWLQAILGPANDFAGKLLSDGFDAEYIYNNRNNKSLLPHYALKKAEKIPLSIAEEIIVKCAENDIKIITPKDSSFPKALLNIPEPPLVLYYKGELPLFDTVPSVCIVGPRKVSDYGYKCAYSISARLAIAGFTVISGGAIGCDYAAHDGALVHGGKTVAVLGNGFGADYLKQNEDLRGRIEQNGCLITEYPPFTPASKFTFPKRNRLMAALANGTVLVEAPTRSGALITAGFAAEYGKDLFVIPGTPGDKNYEGSNLLLRDGAKPLVEISDIFSEYLWDYSDRIDTERAYNTTLIKPQRVKKQVKTEKISASSIQKKVEFAEKSINIQEKEEKIKKILAEHLSKNAKIVYNQLDRQIFSPDDLLDCGLNAAEITSALGELEIYGYITGIPGGRYSLK